MSRVLPQFTVNFGTMPQFAAASCGIFGIITVLEKRRGAAFLPCKNFKKIIPAGFTFAIICDIII